MQNHLQVKAWKNVMQLSFLLAASICWHGEIFGQQNDEQFEEEETPPPVVIMSQNERTQLTAISDAKKRTVLCLQLANERLARAEQFAIGEDFENALSELGGYQAVIDNNLKFLERNQKDKKARDNFRKMEMALRQQTPRIETIKRGSPSQFGGFLKTFINFTRDARTRALDSFFSDTVVPESQLKAVTAKDEAKAAANANNKVIVDNAQPKDQTNPDANKIKAKNDPIKPL